MKKKCLKCNGFSTLRRGRLIEHLKDAHQMSTRSAREKVITLHAKLMDNWHSMKGSDLENIRFNSRSYGSVKINALAARFDHGHLIGRLNLTEELFWQVKCWRGDMDTLSEEARQKRLYSSSSSRAKRPRVEGRGSTSTAATPPVGRRNGNTVSPLSQLSTPDQLTGAWAVDPLEYPGLTPPGPESQVVRAPVPTYSGRVAQSPGAGRGQAVQSVPLNSTRELNVRKWGKSGRLPLHERDT